MESYVVYDEDGYRVEYYNVADLYGFWLPDGQTFKVPAEFLNEIQDMLEAATEHQLGYGGVKLCH